MDRVAAPGSRGVAPRRVRRARVPWPLRIFFALLALAAAAVAFVGVFGVPSCQTPGPTRPPGPPPEADLARTDVVLHPEAPIVPGRNAVWCATIQLAWDATADALGLDRLDLGPPAPPDLVAALDRRTFPHEALDPPSYLAAAALGADPASVERLRTRLDAMGLPPPEGLDRLGPEDALAYAVLRKDLPFAEPFVVHDQRLAFAEGPPHVVTFGLDEGDRGDRVARMARQAVFHHGDLDALGPVPFAVELLPRERADRIVIASVPRAATLHAAWAAASAVLGRPGRPMEQGDVLKVPKVDFAATRPFPELAGAPIRRGPPGARLARATQRIELTLSEAGARLFSTAEMHVVLAAAPKAVFDGPFLLALVRRDASHPYLLAWFENDDLFVKD
jgi:hypothetical protein